jgi:ligand-binding SRPBCC domain-containing protein
VPVFQRETTFDAPLDAVWRLHTTGEGLARLTPSVFDLRIEAVRGADTDETLPEGAEIDVSTNPGGVGGRDRWTSVIVESELDDDRAVFTDEMHDGIFPTWVHTHSFETVFGDETLMRDRIEYRLPTVAGDLVSPFAPVGFVPMFAYRHWKAARILES